jgi:hypothetical protein
MSTVKVKPLNIESGDELNIDVGEVELTEEHLIVSIILKSKKERRVGKYCIMETSELRELLAALDKK